MSATQIVPVDLAGGRRYPVIVGEGTVSELATLIPSSARRVAVVSQSGIPVEIDPGIEHRRFTIGDGETAKTLATVQDLCEAWAEWGLTRADCVVGLGGGLVTDVAGFAASAYHRGLPVVHVATTLLAQIDAAIGGKTGVNLPQGKNLVGSFWQPAGVICDTTTLATLPPASGPAGWASWPSTTGWEAVASTSSTWSTGWQPASGSRPRWWRPMSGRRAAGRSSTTATRSPMRSRPRAATSSDTARPLRSAWSTQPNWPIASVGSEKLRWSNIAA